MVPKTAQKNGSKFKTSNKVSHLHLVKMIVDRVIQKNKYLVMLNFDLTTESFMKSCQKYFVKTSNRGTCSISTTQAVTKLIITTVGKL